MATVVRNGGVGDVAVEVRVGRAALLSLAFTQGAPSFGGCRWRLWGYLQRLSLVVALVQRRRSGGQASSEGDERANLRLCLAKNFKE